MHKVSALLSVLLLALSVAAQRYEQYTTSNGLPSSMVYEVYQDSRGFIWFCTDNGVSRFDGKNFDNFSVHDGLTNAEVFRVIEDSKGRLWFLTFNGELCYYYDGKFYSKTQLPGLSLEHNNFFYYDCKEDKKGNLWFLDQYGSLFVFSTNGKFNKVNPIFNGCKYGIVSPFFNYKGALQCIVADSLLRFKILNLESMTFSDVWVKGNKHPFTLPMKNVSITRPDGSVFYMLQEGLGMVKNDTLVCINQDSTTVWNYRIICTERFMHSAWPSDTSKGNGVWAKLSKYRWEKTLAGFPREKAISCIMADRDGNMWISTLGTGVFLFKSINVNMEVRDLKDGLRHSTCTSILPLNNKVFVGLQNHLIAEVSNGKILRHIGMPYARPYRRVKFLKNIGEHKILAGTDDDAFIVNLNDGSTKALPLPNKAIQDAGIKYIVSTLGWHTITTTTRTYKYEDGKATMIYYSRARLLASILINDSTLYLSTIKGFYQIGIQKYKTYVKKEIFNISADIIAMQWDGRNLWCGTSGGGLLVIRDGRILKRINTRDGLSSDLCRSLFIDEDGNCWFASNLGINMIDGKDFKVKQTITQVDGLPSGDVLDMNKVGDTIYAATTAGYCMFSLGDIGLPHILPEIYFRKISTSRANVIPWMESTFTFPYAPGSMKVEFASVGFYSPGSIQYQYKLGTEVTWTNNNSGFVELVNISPGMYQLMIRARDRNGIWGPVKSIHIIITPLWYQTWWWMGFLVLLGCLVVLIFTRYLIQRIKRREAEKTKVSRKIMDLESQSLANQMNPHFIFNSLSAMQMFFLANEGHKGLVYMSDFSKLMRQILQHSRKQSIRLEEELDLIKNYLNLEKVRFNNRFDYEIRVAPEIDTFETIIPPMLLQPLVENAVKYGMATANEKGKILVSVERNSAFQLLVSVADNGAGFNYAAQKKVNENSRPSALKIIGERLKLLNVKNGSPDHLFIEGSDNIPGFPNGTCIKIYVPTNVL